VTVDLLRDSYDSLKRRAAPGVHGVTWQEYGRDLEARLGDLHGLIHRGPYQAQPQPLHASLHESLAPLQSRSQIQIQFLRDGRRVQPISGQQDNPGSFGQSLRGLRSSRPGLQNRAVLWIQCHFEGCASTAHGCLHHSKTHRVITGISRETASTFQSKLYRGAPSAATCESTA
jgi:hypothetical protein